MELTKINVKKFQKISKKFNFFLVSISFYFQIEIETKIEKYQDL